METCDGVYETDFGGFGFIISLYEVEEPSGSVRVMAGSLFNGWVVGVSGGAAVSLL